VFPLERGAEGEGVGEADAFRHHGERRDGLAQQAGGQSEATFP
jgi:hypothetical protein